MVICGTGHRPAKLGGYSLAASDRVQQACIAGLITLSPSLVITGGALGFDQCLAYACVDASIPFDVYVPCRGQSSVWPAASVAAYDRLLGLARRVVLVTDAPYTPAAMDARNRAMVDASSHVLTIWDGTPGGTANCIRYATSLSRPITNLYPLWRGMA